jgi:hypothetical protein
LPSVPKFPGPNYKKKPPCKRILYKKLGAALSTASEVIQGMSLPAFEGAICLLESLIEKWKENLPIRLVGGTFLIKRTHLMA